MAFRDPTRLAADPGASPLLRSLLSDARSDLPSPGDVERISARVEAAIVAGLPPPDISLGPAPSVGGLAGSKALVIGASLVLGTALVATGWVALRGKGHAEQPELPTSPVVTPPMSVSTPSQPEIAPSDEADSMATPLVPGTRVRDPRAAGLSEASLLDLARAELDRNPRRALALTEEHRRRFPSGALGQEREVIAIEALSRMGQTTEAQRRGSDFERRYPDSAHRQKVDQAIRGQ
jgi:hypothetical protein